MKTMRGVSHFSKRVRQTPALFTNYPRVFADLALAETRWKPAEMVFRMRNGYTVACPNADGARFPLYEIFADDAYELDELCAGVDPTATVLDVGGQIGSFSLAVALSLPLAKVHVYEASPTSAGYIRRNVAANGLQDRIVVHSEALSAHVGDFTFRDSGDASGHNGLTAPDSIGGTTVTVRAVPFDQAVADAGGEVQIVKMDVEGAEYDIVLSSSPASWSAVRKIVMEYHPMPGRSLDDLLAFFARVGLEPVRHEPGTREGLGVIWLRRESTR
jgi:FkbM family methyltransferase